MLLESYILYIGAFLPKLIVQSLLVVYCSCEMVHFKQIFMSGCWNVILTIEKKTEVFFFYWLNLIQLKTHLIYKILKMGFIESLIGSGWKWLPER